MSRLHSQFGTSPEVLAGRRLLDRAIQEELGIFHPDRITVHIGAFRFVCTNLAVGGGGVFAGGFMSVHAGEIPIAEITAQLSAYLTGFEAIVAVYRYWTEQPMNTDSLQRRPNANAVCRHGDCP